MIDKSEDPQVLTSKSFRDNHIALVCLDPDAPEGTFRPMLKIMTKEEYAVYRAQEIAREEIWDEELP